MKSTAVFESMGRGVCGAGGGSPGRFSGTACVVPRINVRGHAEIRQKGPIRYGTPIGVAQNQRRKALGGGTPAVRNAS